MQKDYNNKNIKKIIIERKRIYVKMRKNGGKHKSKEEQKKEERKGKFTNYIMKNVK